MTELRLVDLCDGSDRPWLTDGVKFGMYVDAAPDLLDACEYALLHIDVRLKDRMDLFTADERNVLRKAIAKARGA